MERKSPLTAAFAGDTGPLTLIVVCWICAVIFIDPRGDFPANDDWAYAELVRSLVEHGEIRFSPWTATNLISQVFWGAFFSIIFGFSYTSLRISTLFAALVAALALFRLVRHVNGPRTLAMLAALLLLFNPLFCALSFTFMTDVPFVAAQTVSMLLLVVGLRSSSRLLTWSGWLMGLAALLLRQTAFAIPVAFVGAYIAKYGLHAKRLALAFLPITMFLIVQLAYQGWLTWSGLIPFYYGRQLASVIPTLSSSLLVILSKSVETADYIFFYLGLFLLPISIPTVVALLNGRSRRTMIICYSSIATMTLLITIATLFSGRTMPFWKNVWWHSGIGPLVTGVDVPELFWQVITGLSVLGGVLLVLMLMASAYFIVTSCDRRSSISILVFCGLGGLALAGSLVVVDLKYDRYLLPFIPFFVLLSAELVTRTGKSLSRWSNALAGIVVAAMGWYSIVSTYNYLAEKRVKAAVIDSLVARGIARELIDAGGDTDGDLYFARPPNWIPKYVINTPKPGYVAVERHPVSRLPVWESRGEDLIVYKKVNGGP